MANRLKYQKKADQFVVAVKLDLKTEGFTYQKWGAEQRCKSGDWLVDNNGDVYTIDSEVFARTYRKLGPGKYVKTTPIWAEKDNRVRKCRNKQRRPVPLRGWRLSGLKQRRRHGCILHKCR